MPSLSSQILVQKGRREVSPDSISSRIRWYLLPELVPGEERSDIYFPALGLYYSTHGELYFWARISSGAGNPGFPSTGVNPLIPH